MLRWAVEMQCVADLAEAQKADFAARKAKNGLKIDFLQKKVFAKFGQVAKNG